MKKTIFGALALLAGLVACTPSEMVYKDAQVTAVKSLYEPADGKAVTLASSSTAALYFAWEPCKVEDSGSPMYEVLFYKPGESEPVYVVGADDNGFRNHATILHKDMNKICKAAGFSQGNSGTVEWTIRSSRGLNEQTSSARNTLKLTSIEGLEEMPNAFFITGSATEGGADPAKAMEFASPEQGIYEIFCELKAGDYYFTDKKSAEANRYYLDGLKVREGESTTKVTKPGIYRITCDLNVVSATITEISKMGFYFCPTNAVEIEMPYVGNGQFQGSGPIEFHQESWGRDERYKLCMELGDGSWIWWGTKNGTDSRPNDAQADDPSDSYWHIMEWGPMYNADGSTIAQWDNKWKLHKRFDGADIKVTATFNVPQYTHFVEFAN